MKKLLFAALLLGCTVTFTGCDSPDRQKKDREWYILNGGVSRIAGGNIVATHLTVISLKKIEGGLYRVVVAQDPSNKQGDMLAGYSGQKIPVGTKVRMLAITAENMYSLRIHTSPTYIVEVE